MFFIVLMLAAMLGGMGVLIWIGCRRVAGHLRGKPEATRMVVEHVLMPLLGRVEMPTPTASHNAFEVGSRTDRP